MKFKDILKKQKSEVRQGEAARRLGISRQSVNEIVHREVASFRVDTVKKYGKAFGLRFDLTRAFF